MIFKLSLLIFIFLVHSFQANSNEQERSDLVKSILQNLDNASSKSSNFSSDINKAHEEASPLTSLEIGLLQSHISNYWIPPTGAAGESEFKVDIVVELSKDGFVADAQIRDKQRYRSDVTFRAAANSARRAVLASQPLPLPAEKYQFWKEFIFVFDPKSIQKRSFQAKASKKLVPAEAAKAEKLITSNFTNRQICASATISSKDMIYWVPPDRNRYLFVEEAKRRGINCGVKSDNFAAGSAITMASKTIKEQNAPSIQTAASQQEVESEYLECTQTKAFGFLGNTKIKLPSRHSEKWSPRVNGQILKQSGKYYLLLKNGKLLEQTSDRNGADVTRRFSCVIAGSETAQIASAAPSSSNSGSSAELTAAQKEADRLRQELAALKTEQKQEQQRLNSDTQIPLITILSSSADDRRGSIAGRVTDNIAVAEVRVDGAVVPLKSNGSFNWQGFVPAGGLSVVVEAIDTAGLSAMQQVRLERGENEIAALSFERLDPFRGKTAKKNINSLALIIGVSDYELEPDKPALYANRDAQLFQDYAAIKLGVPDKNIFTMINQDADRLKIMKAVKKELARRSEKNKTDVYVFFAGHGLVNSDGTNNMFLLPYDGDPEFLEDSSIDRKQLFADIQAISPRSVTVFLDSCYSGGTRSGGTLVASLRPIAIRAKEQNVPDGFTILSAAKGDQTSQSLEEAKHGLFSYFLMRGLEGDADANNDNQITAGELHSFVTDKVERQSGFKQTPDIQGDAGRVLVRFQ